MNERNEPRMQRGNAGGVCAAAGLAAWLRPIVMNGLHAAGDRLPLKS